MLELTPPESVNHMASQDFGGRPIAVIGMGCEYPGASDLRSLWENILTKRCQFRQIPDVRLPASAYFDADAATPDKTYGRFAAVIDGFKFDWVKRRIPKSTVDSTDTVHWLSIEVAERALLDAGYTRQTVPTQKTGVIVGNTLTGEESRTTTLRLRWPYMERALRAATQVRGLSADATDALIETTKLFYKSAFAEITEDSLAGGLANTIAGRVCNYFNLDGGGYTVDGACASSLLALITGAKALADGDLDLALIGGVDMSLDPFELIGFAKTGALTPERMTVYDRQASGFIPGEGCGFVVLKRLEEAQAAGDYIYAVLNGWGISSDGKGGITAPTSEGQSKALLRAYAKAGYGPQSLDFIEGHGTGTPKGDRIELQGIALALGSEGAVLPRQVGVTSFKSLVGHTKAAAGIGGFIKAVMAVNQRVIPPTVGCKDPNPIFETEAQGVYPVLNGVIRGATDTLRAGVSAMGFGGINSHVTLASGHLAAEHLKSKLSPQALLTTPQDTELFIMTAPSLEGLRDRIQVIRQQAGGICIAELADLACHLTNEIDETHPLRAGIIADHPDTLLVRLDELGLLLQDAPLAVGEVKTTPLQQVWVANSVQRSRVAFVFPGQGSQRLNMGRNLAMRSEWALPLIEMADRFSQPEVQRLSDKVYRALELAENKTQVQGWEQELAETAVAQPAICLTSLLWMRYLDDLGISPCAVGGHSLGELTAFHAAGAFDAQTLLAFAALRGQVMTPTAALTGKMASLACSREVATRLIEQQEGGHVAIANLNSPQQTVISGTADAVEAVVALALKAEIQARVLPVANAFHTQMMQPAADILKTQAPLPDQWEGASIPIFSSMSGQAIANNLSLKDHFAEQVTHSVDFISQIQAMSSHCDLMVEVGPGRVLSNLVKQVQGDGGRPACLPIESKPGEYLDFNTFLASYFVHGGIVHWHKLYENRLVRPFVAASDRQFFVNPCENPFKVSEAELANHPKLSALSAVQSQPKGTSVQRDRNGSSANQPVVTSLSAFDELFSQSELDPNFDQTFVQLLSKYFEHRSSFLANLIQADLENLSR